MKLETFFEKFDQFAEAPNAVAKLRELACLLAVQGKLVPQDSSDESAAAFLGQISTAIAGHPTNRKNHAETADSELDTDSAPFTAPPGWVWTTLGSVQVFTNGYAFKSEDYQSTGIGIIRMGELGANGEIDETNMKFVSPEIAQSLPDTFSVNPGDLLMGMSGSIGKLAINRSNKTYLLNQRVGRLEPVLIEKEFLRVFLKTVEQHYLRISFGMAIKNLSTKQINETPFPLPPLAEQKRIVAKVDELMALCDRLETKQWERDTRRTALVRASLARFADAPTPANLNLLFHSSYAIAPADLRKAILTLAVQGKLVPQDQDDEPAEMLASEIAEIRHQLVKDGNIRSQTISAPPNEQDLPFATPDSWQWIRLGLAVSLLGGYAYPSGAYVSRSSNQIIRLGNVKNDDLLLDQKPAYIPDSLAEETAAFEIRVDDILVTMTGTKAKRDYAFTLIVEPAHVQTNRLFLNQRVGAIRPFRKDFVPLINLFLKSSELLDMVFVTATGTANQANIGIAAILDLPFPLPPLAEQRRIVAKVDQLMALVDQLETQLAASRATAVNLMEAVVAELTAQE